ncbi:4-alpha-glucanotransferase [candidate division KSB1 bacterium]|nr:4-alpha-glucanotransferase [candidate division KSB1 bacterium]
MNQRRSGILLHICSLPTNYGIGDLGPEAYRFVDFLAESGQTYWQILPLNPTDPRTDNSPYLSISAFAFNPYLISPDRMIESGLLEINDCRPLSKNPSNTIYHQEVIKHKNTIFDLAFEKFRTNSDHSDFNEFCRTQAVWLDPFAEFVALRKHFKNKIWTEWPKEFRDRDEGALDGLTEVLALERERTKFLQFLFYQQWSDLKSYCKKKGIQILGDIPIYVALDSVDVWANPEIFKLDKEKCPLFVAGCPPDYFSETGQLWGNPVFDWKVLSSSKYRWWIDRIKHNIELFDFVRIDHFRGLVGYWEIHAGEETAINGEWIPAPAKELFTAVKKECPNLPVFAEDLGVITQDVIDVMNEFDLPGMKVLQFAFGGEISKNPYIPYNVPKNSVLYTGTHDNNTVRGWFEHESTKEERQKLFQYIGHTISPEDAPWTFIRLALSSPADTVIVPIQDVIGLGVEHRINNPSTIGDNWKWKLAPGQLDYSLSLKLKEMIEIYGRKRD